MTVNTGESEKVQKDEEIVSHHLLRRTARKKKKQLAKNAPAFFRYRVRSARRGPFGWYVVEYEVKATPPKRPVRKPKPTKPRRYK